MAADSAREIVEAIRELDDDGKAAIGKELAPYIPVTLDRRQMLGVGAAALLGAGGATGTAAAAQRAVEPARAADGVVNDVDVLKSGDGSTIGVQSPVEFTQTVEHTGQVDIADFSAVLEKSTDQAVSADTDTPIEWDNQDVDTNLYTYDGTNHDIDVLAAGDYAVQYAIAYKDISSGDDIFPRIFVNGSVVRGPFSRAAGASDSAIGAVTLKDLSANDTIRIDARTNSSGGGTVKGDTEQTYAMISKQA